MKTRKEIEEQFVMDVTEILKEGYSVNNLNELNPNEVDFEEVAFMLITEYGYNEKKETLIKDIQNLF